MASWAQAQSPWTKVSVNISCWNVKQLQKNERDRILQREADSERDTKWLKQDKNKTTTKRCETTTERRKKDSKQLQKNAK